MADRDARTSDSRAPQQHAEHSDRDRDRDRRSHRSRRDSRSRSPPRRRRHGRESPSRSESPGRDSHRDGPPDGVAEIHEEDDYFRKATELKLWLWEEKSKKLDSLRTEDARRYFRKFCRAWNRGRLSANYYAGISPASLPSSISSSHSWSFSKASQADLDAAASIRKSIDTGTKTRSYDPSAASTVAGPTLPRRLGPTLPPPAAGGGTSAVERLQLERDARDSVREAERAHVASQRRRENREARQDERDERATGRDRLVEKRREGNLARREFESAREAGGMVEIDDETLMGGQAGGFDAAVRERERQQRRREERRGGKLDEKKAELTDRYQAYKGKEDQTMAMFKQLAAARFGGGGSGGT